MTKAALWAKSIGLGILAAIAYGIVHDQISVRISPPYLMDWHPQLFSLTDPTMIALAWGIVATWWFGLILGAVLALAATLGRRPVAPWTWIVRAMAAAFVFAALVAIIALWLFAELQIELPNFFGDVYAELSHQERLAFSRTAAMHEASYDAAGVATVIAAIVIYVKRGKSATGTVR